MPQLLLELLSEEIPARMQAQAARDLERLVGERLRDAGLGWETMQAFAGPRRLALVIEGLPAAQADRSEERKGPRANAPEQALEGFLRSTGLTRDQLEERDGVLFAKIERKGRPTAEIIAETVDVVVRAFPWPKSMTWGRGTLRWVRPLQRIVCLFDGRVVPFEIDGLAAGDTTQGHRFMGSGQPFHVGGFDDYRKALQNNFVVLAADDRKAAILEKAKAVCEGAGLSLVDDIGLLEEVSGLAEWPVPILGGMDPAFLDLPAEVIRTSMRTHQKYFAVSDPRTGKLAPHFITVANIEASDGGAAVAAGNARVLSARLNDARFFWDQDRAANNFDRWLKKLEGVTFHASLGTMAQRVSRIQALAREIAPLVGADPDKAEDAARLAKADLASGMVGEFPELQGVMGGYYAREARIDPEIADAVRDHYRPQGPGDAAPSAPLTVAVALADKLDTLAGFFAIDEKPTGSKDPYALRRAALGVIRIVLEGGLRLPLSAVLQKADAAFPHRRAPHGPLELVDVVQEGQPSDTPRSRLDARGAAPAGPDAHVVELLAFFADRLKVSLRDQGKRHDLVDAVFALGDDDLVRIVARVEALDGFLTTEDGANLLAGYRRAGNILKAEAKKGALPRGAAQPHPGAAPEETALASVVGAAEPRVAAALEAEDFAAAMSALAGLRGPVDAFFEKVLVNSEVAAERDNRLRLLGQVRDLMGRVADFSLITG
ncbi:MAG: glycine--tRNA ligase subunit beta [Caulobacteraceae bacterium]|nr:glycine--tRNA ligase subunit beta [Caulobacteraceae bacterium]